MTKLINKDNIMKIMDNIYNQTLNGLPMPGGESAQELAESYLKEKGSISDKADSLIRWQIAKCATSGFLTGLGGFLTLPITLPANIGSVLYVQLRMIAAIAYMGGYNPKDDKVKTFVYVCLLGNSNKAVGVKLVTKFGEKGIINLGKAIPAVGGIIGGTLDGIATKTIGAAAKKMFLSNMNNVKLRTKKGGGCEDDIKY